ncbi:cytochrome P450 [Plectosphaerella plurivora]|uniref:Cytochrome P450 n=1 Tax=Plectosphaerella plurivora TaxID=936078 RepID=A0A9P8V1K8_9PEZI|nr:cytochrome P450 [Plectosphaerella plurivora]
MLIDWGTVNETLRWRPGVPGGVPNVTRIDDEYLGYRIPANSIILPNHFTIARDESVFGSDVDSFTPDRWMTDNNTTRPDACGFNMAAIRDLPYVGFGYGRRGCTGRYIARMLWAFDVETGVDEVTGERSVVDDMTCTEGFATMPKPFRAVMRPRGPWVRSILVKEGPTHGIDHSNVLDQARSTGQ